MLESVVVFGLIRVRGHYLQVQMIETLTSTDMLLFLQKLGGVEFPLSFCVCVR